MAEDESMSTSEDGLFVIKSECQRLEETHKWIDDTIRQLERKCNKYRDDWRGETYAKKLEIATN